MVYNGKPSRACLPCRKRKLRCDLKRNFCGQCIRAGLECSGYRNPNELRIQDQTKHVKQKALVSKGETVPRFGDLSIQQKSRGAFFSHYVHGITGSYDVIELLNKTSPLENHLDTSINALARKTYLSAIKLVNSALQNPTTLSSDSTLLAVLLLDLFEKITNSNPKSSIAWMSHVNGGLALIKLRDSIHLQTYIGRRLSFRLSTSLLISCVAANAPVPPALKSLRAELESHVNIEDPKWKLTGLSIKTADFRAEVQNGSLSGVDIILEAKKLDNELSSLSANMPKTWLTQRKYLQGPSKRVFGQFYDLYPGYFTTQTHNVIRITRIMLNDTIRTIYKEEALDCNTLTSDTIHLSFIDRIIDDLAREICASGPQFIGDDDSQAHQETITHVQKFFCHTLIFPFYVAALYASTGSMIKIWVISQLRHISGELGIRHADTVADILEGEDPMDPWSVYAILGSYAFAA